MLILKNAGADTIFLSLEVDVKSWSKVTFLRINLVNGANSYFVTTFPNNAYWQSFEVTPFFFDLILWINGQQRNLPAMVYGFPQFCGKRSNKDQNSNIGKRQTRQAIIITKSIDIIFFTQYNPID